MAKKEEIPTLPSPLQREGGPEAREGSRLVTILYSRDHDLYRVPAIDKVCWLSVKTYELPVAQLATDAIYLGGSTTADGLRWRKAFHVGWRSIVAGDRVTVPEDDPLVLDYEAAKNTG